MTGSTLTLDEQVSAASAGKYGYGKFPFGHCQADGCTKAACHRTDDALVCRDHLPEEIVFSPFLGQQENCWSRTERWVLYGGGAGGAKSHLGARLWIKQWQVEQARWENGEIDQSVGWAIFFRRTMPELLQIMEEFKRYYKRIDEGATWNERDKMATFPNGYRVQFAGIEGEDDYLKYLGPAYTLMVLDEGVTFTQKQIEWLDTRLRCADPVLGKMLQFVVCTNPIGSVTKQYLKRRFVAVADANQPVLVRTKLADGRTVEEWQIYIPANLYDNPALMEDGRYEASLMQRGAAVRRALLLNDWDVDEGAWVGDDWDPSVHICEPFPIPKGWTRIKMGDYGFSEPGRTSITWVAIDSDDNWVGYRHFSCWGKTVEEVGRAVREIEIQAGEWDRSADCSLVYGPMDSSLWARVGETGPSRGEVLDNMGCCFTRSDKNPDSAAEQIRSRLRRRSPDAHGNLTIPGLRFFRTCKMRLRSKTGEVVEVGPVVSISLLGCDPNNPDRWDTAGDDHDMDALGYGCLSRPVPGLHEAPKDTNEAVVLELLRFREEPQRKSAFPSW